MRTIRNNSLGNLKFLAAILAAGLALWGCDQGVPESGPMKQSSASQASAVVPAAAVPDSVVSAATANQKGDLSDQEKATNRQLEVVALALAKTLGERKLRRYVYERAMERFDGDTNVLWQDLVDPEASQEKVPGTGGWNTQVKDALPPGKARGMAHKLGNTIERAGRLMNGPTHLYWAKAASFKSGHEASELRAPLVTFTPIGVNFDQNRDLLAFDAQGETHVVNEVTMKERPIVVLAGNERTDDEGNVLEPYQEASAVKGQLTTNAAEEPCEDQNQYESTCGGGGGGGGGGDDDPHTRDIPDREPGDLQILYYTHLNVDTEGGSRGLPELHLTIEDSQNRRVDDGYGDRDDGDFYYDHHADENEWQLDNDNLFNWEPGDSQEEGFYVTFDWREDDGDEGDDDYGSATVNYGHSSTRHYTSSNGSIEWTLRWE
jgi:hypothetical protein